VSEHPHLIDGKFQSDKYPECPRGKVPLSVDDKSAQDLLWEYAQRRRAIDAQFADDLELALRIAGFSPTHPVTVQQPTACSCASLVKAPTTEVISGCPDGQTHHVSCPVAQHTITTATWPCGQPKFKKV